MTALSTWKKSSYSGGGQGDACVEVACTRTHIAVRDSKTPARGTLTFHVGVFAPFVRALKLADEAGQDDSAARTARTSPCARGSAVTVLRKPFVT